MLKISVMDTSGVVVQGLLQASTWLPILDLSDQKKDIRSRLALWKVSGCLNKPILTKGATRRNLHTLLQFPNWQICCTSSLSRSWLLRDSSIWFSTKPSEAWLRLQLQDGLGRGDCCQAAGPKQIKFTNNFLVTDLRTWIYGFGAGLGGSTPCDLQEWPSWPARATWHVAVSEHGQAVPSDPLHGQRLSKRYLDQPEKPPQQCIAIPGGTTLAFSTWPYPKGASSPLPLSFRLTRSTGNTGRCCTRF